MLSVSLMIFSSCDFLGGDSKETEQEQTSNVQQIVALPDSIKEKIEKQDVLAQSLIAKIDTLTDELNSAKSDIAELKSKVEELKSPNSVWNFISITAFILGIISMALSLCKSKKLKKMDKNFSICLAQSPKFQEIEKRVNGLELQAQGKKSQSSHTFTSNGIESRIGILERTMNQVVDVVNKLNAKETQREQAPQVLNTAEDQSSISKTGYAKINTDKYILDIVNSNQEGCVYKITFQTSTKGEFDLISLDKIKSRNGWQEVVEYDGNCTMAEALSYRLVHPGVIVKMDDKTWEVIKKLKIKIFK